MEYHINFCHPEQPLCHPEQSLCHHQEPLCHHQEPLCHPEQREGSPRCFVPQHDNRSIINYQLKISRRD